jgi:hypothetical protein
MSNTAPGLTMNKWLLLLLATIAFSISGYQRWLQQDWLALGAVVAAWLIVIWLIQRHRRQGAAVLGAEITSLQSQLQLDGDLLRIADESWPCQAISQVEMGVIDQHRAYLYLTIESEPTSSATAARTRKFLMPYTEYEQVRQQLSAALPNAHWLLPQD